MAINYSTAVKNSRLQAVVDSIDAAASAGTLELGTSGMASVLAIWTLADPCGTVAAGVLTFDVDPDISATAIASGTAAEARIKDGDGTVIVSGLTVGTSGTDIIIDSTDIVIGQTIVLETGAITAG